MLDVRDGRYEFGLIAYVVDVVASTEADHHAIRSSRSVAWGRVLSAQGSCVKGALWDQLRAREHSGVVPVTQSPLFDLVIFDRTDLPEVAEQPLDECV